MVRAASPPPEEGGDPTSRDRSRRELIAGAAALGLTAWVAPKVLDVGVAGAAPTTYYVQYNAASCTTPVTTTAPLAANCPTGWPVGVNPGSYPSSIFPTFTPGRSCACGSPGAQWTAPTGCRIVDAKAVKFCPAPSSGGQYTCVNGTLTAGLGNTATFPVVLCSTNCQYVNFRLTLTCGS